ncbi:myb-related transcription factor, partner of profilin-like [Triticum dicoccoides]|uniref:myb-related transcription factor, partner of profilin-like n=1 Tax=Triticum dicoccoides TaxID=85692 RepID=UPI00188E58C0|nr:myb-related transcription factor, partner of profilin-like [Triticum dicoccoides]
MKPPTPLLLFPPSPPVRHHAPIPLSPVDPARSSTLVSLPDLAALGHDAASSGRLDLVGSSPPFNSAGRRSSGSRRSSSWALSPFTSYAMYRPLPEAPPHPCAPLMSPSGPRPHPPPPACTRPHQILKAALKGGEMMLVKTNRKGMGDSTEES